MPPLDITDLTKSTYSFPAAPTPAPTPAPAPAPTSSSPESYSNDKTPCGCEAGDYRPECWQCDDPSDPRGNDPCPDGSGTHWDPAEGKCVLDSTPTPAAPMECPPGYKKGEGFWSDVCVEGGGPPRNNAGSGSGSGNGSAAPSGGPPRSPSPAAPTAAPAIPFKFSPQVTDFNALLDKMIREGLAAPSRFTPQALQALYGQITRQASGRIQRGTAAVRADAARRGMQRAGSTSAAIRGVRDTAESERGNAVVGVQLAKINADYADKLGALDRAQKYLDSLRDSEYRMLIATEQRRQFDANLALSYANLAQQRSMLDAQLKAERDRLTMILQSDWDKLQAIFGFQTLSQGL